MPDLFYDALPELRGAFMLHGPLTDMELVTLTPRLGSYFGTDQGVLVVRAPAGGALKLEDGDVITRHRRPSADLGVARHTDPRLVPAGREGHVADLRQRKTLEIAATVPEGTRPAHHEWRDDGSAAETRVPPARVVSAGRGTA